MEEKDRGSSEKIANELRAQILSGDLFPGSRILQEQLAVEFGASRLPVRDALRRLQADGLVTIVVNTGAWVSKLKQNRVRRGLSHSREAGAASRTPKRRADASRHNCRITKTLRTDGIL